MSLRERQEPEHCRCSELLGARTQSLNNGVLGGQKEPLRDQSSFLRSLQSEWSWEVIYPLWAWVPHLYLGRSLSMATRWGTRPNTRALRGLTGWVMQFLKMPYCLCTNTQNSSSALSIKTETRRGSFLCLWHWLLASISYNYKRKMSISYWHPYYTVHFFVCQRFFLNFLKFFHRKRQPRFTELSLLKSLAFIVIDSYPYLL